MTLQHHNVANHDAESQCTSTVKHAVTRLLFDDLRGTEPHPPLSQHPSQLLVHIPGIVCKEWRNILSMSTPAHDCEPDKLTKTKSLLEL
jgi:hypothetical protein